MILLTLFIAACFLTVLLIILTVHMAVTWNRAPREPGMKIDAAVDAKLSVNYRNPKIVIDRADAAKGYAPDNLKITRV